LIVTSAVFGLSPHETTKLEYESATRIADEHGIDYTTLQGKRETIMLAREKAGSLLDKAHPQKTAGSFFKNPIVTVEQAERIMQYEEFGVSTKQISRQNAIHGGSTTRVSAAHVLLAAGFKRGQTWGPVRIHPDHILKIENTGGASSQQIYDVALEIVQTVKSKLGIDIEPEVRFMGDFS
jgi:UDP-N-acetylmuramate dehydrogenase